MFLKEYWGIWLGYNQHTLYDVSKYEIRGEEEVIWEKRVNIGNIRRCHPKGEEKKCLFSSHWI